MRIGRQHHRHRRVVRFEQRSAGVADATAPPGRGRRCARRNPHCSASRPRSNRIASRSFARCGVAVGTELGQHGAAVHRAIRARRGKARRALVPAGRGEALGGKRAAARIDAWMAMPPRAVMAETRAIRPRPRQTGSSRSRENSAMAPNVPRLHCVSGLAISRLQQIGGGRGGHGRLDRKIRVGIDEYSPGVSPGEYRLLPLGQAARTGFGDKFRRSERRAGLHHVGPARQRIGAEDGRP